MNMPISVTFSTFFFFCPAVVGNMEKILLHGSVNKVCYWFPLRRIGEKARQQKEKVFNKN